VSDDAEPIVSAEPEPPDPDDVERPRWVKGALLAFVAAVVVIVLVAVAWGQWLEARHAAECRQAVKARDENRSMWSWLGEQRADTREGEQFLADLRAELDIRLPRLECDPDSNPIPVETTAAGK